MDNESEYSINQSTQSIDQLQDQNGSANNGEQNGNDKRKFEQLDVENSTKKLKSWVMNNEMKYDCYMLIRFPQISLYIYLPRYDFLQTWVT